MGSRILGKRLRETAPAGRAKLRREIRLPISNNYAPHSICYSSVWRKCTSFLFLADPKHDIGGEELDDRLPAPHRHPLPHDEEVKVGVTDEFGRSVGRSQKREGNAERGHHRREKRWRRERERERERETPHCCLPLRPPPPLPSRFRSTSLTNKFCVRDSEFGGLRINTQLGKFVDERLRESRVRPLAWTFAHLSIFLCF